MFIGMTSQSRNYRAWTNIEETKLVEALVIMVNTGGFRADQGFKSGYLTHLEHLLKKSMPNSGILGKPHIESKIKVMKRDWQTVHDMLNSSHTSGFSYDTVKHCMIADDQVWESYLQVKEITIFLISYVRDCLICLLLGLVRGWVRSGQI